MQIKVARLSERAIEAEASAVLERYTKECEPILKPPVPVDDLPEMILKVRLEFDDLRKMLGRNDVIGATWFETHEIYIDQSLDPTDHPRKRGRYRFTVGHEIGHWVGFHLGIEIVQVSRGRHLRHRNRLIREPAPLKPWEVAYTDNGRQRCHGKRFGLGFRPDGRALVQSSDDSVDPGFGGALEFYPAVPLSAVHVQTINQFAKFLARVAKSRQAFTDVLSGRIIGTRKQHRAGPIKIPGNEPRFAYQLCSILMGDVGCSSSVEVVDERTLRF